MDDHHTASATPACTPSAEPSGTSSRGRSRAYAPTPPGNPSRAPSPTPTGNPLRGTSRTPSRATSTARSPAADPDTVIRELAATQHGVVTREQLVRAGVPAHRIEYRLKAGRLRSLHRGVYGVGPVAATREREMAAVLACGERAVLSHVTASVAWGFVPAPATAAPPVDVTIRAGWRAPGPRVRVHRCRTLAPDEITSRDGLPITTPERTLLDLATGVRGRELERALARADREGLLDRGTLERIMGRNPGRRGTRRLRALLTDGVPPALTRSEAETRFLTLIRKARLRAPETNVIVRGHEVDFLWRAERLVVEIDGFAFHSSRSAFEADRRRDRVLAAAGLRVIRVTWAQLTKEPEELLAQVILALAAAPVDRR